MEVTAYALVVGGAAGPDADAETARTLLAALADIGLDALVGAKRAYVPVTRPLLLAEDAPTLPPDRLALVIPPDVAPDDLVLAGLARPRAAGHRIVLGSFVAGGARDALLPLCDVVAIDVRTLRGSRALVRAAADPAPARRRHPRHRHRRPRRGGRLPAGGLRAPPGAVLRAAPHGRRPTRTTSRSSSPAPR
jgi:hypothetical protein